MLVTEAQWRAKRLADNLRFAIRGLENVIDKGAERLTTVELGRLESARVACVALEKKLLQFAGVIP